MGTKIVHVLIIFWWMSTCGMVNANCDTTTIAQSCNYFNSSNNYEYSAAFDNICYAFSGAHVTVQSFEEAYDACNAAKGKPSNPFDYGRVAVFRTPDIYQQFTDMLRIRGVNEYIVLGAVNDGRPGSQYNEYVWALDKSESMCYVFDEDGVYGPDNPIATVKTVGTAGGGGQKVPPNDLPSSYYVLCGNPTKPFQFEGHANDNLGLTYICEFGCGTAPDYTTSKTPEWWGTETSTTSTFTSKTSSTSSPQTTASPSSATCDDTLMQSVQSEITGAQQDSPFDADLFFNEPSTGTTFWYGYIPGSHGLPSSLAKMDDLCSDMCQSANANFYGRTAILRSKAAYDAIFAMLLGQSNTIIAVIGAASPTMDATKLNQYFWTTINTTDPCLSCPITNQSTIDVSLFIDDPNRSVLAISVRPTTEGFASTNVGFTLYDYICECGCAPYVQVGSTAPWWDISTTTSATPTTTAESMSSSSSSPTASSTISSDVPTSAECAKSYDHIASCVIDAPIASGPSMGTPQDCANLCTSNPSCRSFNFRLGDATCNQNKCELFSKISTEVDPGQLTSEIGCVHYDSVGV